MSQENLTSEYSYDLNSFWTKNAASFYFYISANGTTIEPQRIFMDEVVDLFISSSDDWSFKNTLVGDTDFPREVITRYFGNKIFCKFGDFGKTKARYIRENLITCSTPPIKTNLALIYEVEKTLSLTFNGRTYIQNLGLNVKFIGVNSPLLYTWIFVGFFVGLGMFIGLVFYIMKYKRKRIKIQ